MFRCEKCQQLSQPGEAAVRVITETRAKEYPRREEAMRKGQPPHVRWVADPGGHGMEIAGEEIRHAGCVDA